MTTYPLTLPTSPGIRSARLTARSVVAVAASPFTGAQQVYRHQGEWWEAEVTLPPMRRATAEAWNAFRLKLRGRYGTLLFGDPDGKTPRGNGSGRPVVDGANQSGDVVNLRGWTISAVTADSTAVTCDSTEITADSSAVVLRAGDYIDIADGNGVRRLYKVLDDVEVTNVVTGTCSVPIWPALRRPAPVDGAPVTYQDAKGTFRLSDNAMGWDTDEAGIYGISVGLVEAL